MLNNVFIFIFFLLNDVKIFGTNSLDINDIICYKIRITQVFVYYKLY